jgi:hypothetical protein
MSQPDKQDPVATAHGLIASVKSLGDDVRGLAAAVRRSRILIRITIIGMLVDVLATTAAVVAISVASHANSRADQAEARAAANHASNLAACRGGNVTRHGEIQVWKHLVVLAPPTTAKGRRLDNEFLAYVAGVWAPRDCVALYRTP